MKKKGHPETKYLMPKGCLVQPFVELGVRKHGLGEFLGLPYKQQTHSTSWAIKTCTWLRGKSRRTFGVFLLTLLALGLYHNELVFPFRNLHPKKDHILVDACKKLNSNPFSLAP